MAPLSSHLAPFCGIPRQTCRYALNHAPVLIGSHMIREIQAKTLVSRVKSPDAWFGMRYNMNLYRGCQHQCIYCDSRSECYHIEDFGDVLVKINAIELLQQELASKRVKGTLGTGSMHDPYMPIEAKYNLTGQALQVIATYGFGVHINTKSDLILKDLETLRTINRVHASVCFSITTADDSLASILEPGAPSVAARLRAAATLASAGIHTGIAMMPILPLIEDSVENITAIVQRAHEHGLGFILPGFGVTLRDRQRAYYYAQLDQHFPGLVRQYERAFGQQYHCQAGDLGRLESVFVDMTERYGIARRVPTHQPEPRAEQLDLF